MDDNSQSTSESSKGENKNWILIAIVVIAIVILIAGGGYFYMNSQKQNTTVESEIPSPTAAMEESGASPEPQSSNYKDGTYSATGSYITPGGTEQIGVRITIANGQVTEATVVQMGKTPTAKVKQADFADNFNPLVVGKAIDEVNLDVVSGSSLTPKGFMNAIEQIRSQAQS